MSNRSSASFAPLADDFTSFSDELLSEEQKENKAQSWFSNAAKYLFSASDENSKPDSTDKQFHELMVCALNDKKINDNSESHHEVMAGVNVDKYILTYLPSHLIRAQMFQDVSNMLLDIDFMSQRIKTLGSLEATKRLTIDLTELKKQNQKKMKETAPNKEENLGETPDFPQSDSLDTADEDIDSAPPQLQEESNKTELDVSRTQREACRRMIDAVRRAEFQTSSSGNSINVAVCLSLVAEFLLKARIIRDAVARFEESLDLFRKLLGKNHVDVARAMNALAKAYIKGGDNRTALTKLSEAHHIYEICDQLHQYDAISNNLLIATLLVDSGDWEHATLKYDEVISMRQKAYGNESISVAKSMNEYAVVLAKHNRMSEALRQYETARDVYVAINKQEKFSFDITLIELNIASIKSKLGNYQGALESYERGVVGLRLQIQMEMKVNDSPENSRLAVQKRHLVSAMGRIGSMRMKLKDNSGALKAYLMLIKDVDKKSPKPSQMEKARAHVKCATIFRQTGTAENNVLAISHLSQALQMYTILHGVDHKDTRAIGSSLKQWQKTDASAQQ